MGFTNEQFKEWVNEAFPDNVARAIAERDFRDGLNKLADYVFETNTSEFIQGKITEINGLKTSAETAAAGAEAKRLAVETLFTQVQLAKSATDAIKSQAQLILDNAIIADNPLGDYNATTNTPALTAIPPAAPAVPKGSWYSITDPGILNFAGSNFASGKAAAAGGRMVKKSETLWYYQQPSDQAYQKSLDNKASIETPFISENLLLNSAALDKWNKTGTTVTLIDDVLGLGYGGRIFETAETNDHFMTFGSVSLVAGTPSVFSVYVRPGTRPTLSLSLGTSATWSGTGAPEITFNTTTGVFTKNAQCAAADIIKLQNGWYRMWLMSNTHITGTTAVRLRLKNGSAANYLGDTAMYGDFCFPQASRSLNLVPYSFTFDSAQAKAEGQLVSMADKANWNGKISSAEVIIESGKNLFNVATGTDGFYLGSGVPSVNSSYGYSAFIPVVPGQIYTGFDGVNQMRVITCYNASKVYVSDFSQAPQKTVTIPANIYFVKVSYYVSRKASFQFELSATDTAFEAYTPPKVVSLLGYLIGGGTAGTITQDSTHRFVSDAEKAVWNAKVASGDIVIANSKNLFDLSTGTDGFYLNADASTSASATYGYSDFIPVTAGDIWTGFDGVNKCRRINFYNASKVNQSSLAIDGPNNPITIPAGVSYVKVTYYAARKATFQFEKSAVATTYQAFGKSLVSIQGAVFRPVTADILQDETHRFVTDLEKAAWNAKLDYTANAILPSKMYAIVGREFNLYYDAFTLFPEYGAGQPNFLFDIDCAKGIISYRSFRLTPVAGDVGEYPFTFTLRDQFGAAVQVVTSTLVVVAANNPSTVKRALHFGDSTIDEGTSTKTLQENLAAIGGNVPVFHGQHWPAPYRNEARTGRSYGSFALGATAYKFTATGLNPALNVSNIRQAYYSHGNTDNQVILSERWKINPDGTATIWGYFYGVFVPPTAFPTTISATPAGLAAGFPATINVTACETLPNFSIFKDNDGIGALNIAFYRTEVLGMPAENKFDTVIIDLGINDVGSSVNGDSTTAGFVNSAKLLYAAFVADNAACKVIFCLPKSRASDYYVTSRKQTNFRVSIHKLRKKLIEAFDFKAEFPNAFISQSGYSVDRFYGYPTAAKAPAARIATPTFLGATDDVHPATGGYQQHADGLTGCVAMALNL